MPRVYTKQSPPECSRNNCARAVKARGLCNTHYVMWHRKNAGKIAPQDSNLPAVLAALPGNVSRLAEKTGMTIEAVDHAVRKLRKRHLIHVEDWAPPLRLSGSRHTPIFTLGPGEDAPLTKKMRRESHLASRRAWHAANIAKPPKSDPLLWAVFRRPTTQPKEEMHE